MRWLRWTEADLEGRSKGHAVKVALAARLRRETTLTVGWMAERLRMGSRDYASQLLWQYGRKHREEYSE